MIRRATKPVLLMAAGALILTSCGGTPIEDIARSNIRAMADDALKRYRHVMENAEHGTHDVTSQQLGEVMPGLYSVTWATGIYPTAEVYLRDHVTTSGGFWGEQRTVSSCVRYTFDGKSAAMQSVECPSSGPPSEYTDERVNIP